MHGQRGEQFRLAAGLDAEMVGRAGVHDFLHHLAKLVHLDRKNAAIAVFVAGFRDGRGEGFIDRLHAIPQQILEAQHQRKIEARAFGLLDHLHDVDRRLGLTRRQNLDIPALIDRKIARAPSGRYCRGKWRRGCPKVASFGAHTRNARRVCNRRFEKLAHLAPLCRRADKRFRRGIFPSTRRPRPRFPAMNKPVVPVEIRTVLPFNSGRAVFIGNAEKVFVIYVDESVGAAISMFINHTPKERPLTHDLIGHLMAGAGREGGARDHQ